MTARYWIAGVLLLFSLILAVFVADIGIDTLRAMATEEKEKTTAEGDTAKAVTDAAKKAEAAAKKADAASKKAEGASKTAETAANQAKAAADAAGRDCRDSCPKPACAAVCACPQQACPTPTPAATEAASTDSQEKSEEASEESEDGAQSTAADLLIPLIGLVFGFGVMGVLVLPRPESEAAPAAGGSEMLRAYELAARAHLRAKDASAILTELQEAPDKWPPDKLLKAMELAALVEQAGSAARDAGTIVGPFVDEGKTAVAKGEAANDKAKALREKIKPSGDHGVVLNGAVAAVDAAKDAARAAAKAARAATTPPSLSEENESDG